MDAREFRLDTLNQTVEMIVSKTRKLADTMVEDNERVEMVDEGSGSDGWMDPSQGNSEPQVLQESPLGITDPSSDLSPFDPHKHANRRTVAKHGTKQSEKRVREAATKSTRHRPSTRRRDPKPETTKHRRRTNEKRPQGEGLEGGSGSEKDSYSNPDTDPSRDSDDDKLFASSDDVPAVFVDDETPSRDRNTVRFRHGTKQSKKRAREAATESTRHRPSAHRRDRNSEATKRRRERHKKHTTGQGLEGESESHSNPDTDPSRDSDDDTMFASNDDVPEVFPDDETPSNGGNVTRLRRRRATLEPAFFDAGAQIPDRTDTVNGKDRIPIADRMQRFLDANDGGGLDFQPELIGNREKSHKRVRRNRSGAREKSIDSHGTGSDGISKRPVSVSPAEEEGVNPVELFSLLDDAPDRPVERRRVQPPCETMPDLCQFLIENFPDPVCANVLEAIVAKSAVSISDGSENSTLVFTTILKVLQCHGKATLQELVSAESASIDVQVSLLATALRLLRLGVNSNLTPADGVVFDLFSPDRCGRYIDFMVRQTVEAAFSLVHPSAWALKIKSPRKLLRALEPLRDALGEHVHVVERASRCLDQELEPQEWRYVRDGEHVFVSSLNPDSWLAFLDSGKPLPESGTLRSLGFQKELPRCEVNAMWSLLAYLSCSTKPILEEKGVHRWQLISKIFTRSVLAGSLSEPLPPCESQLEICASELKNMTSLLLSGALDCLPGRDSILVNLVRRSLMLQGDAFLYDEDSRLAAYPSIKDEKAEKRCMVKLWERIGDETITVVVAQGRSTEIGKTLSSQKAACSFMGQPIVLPSSWITRCCLALVSAWTQRVPVKKVRQTRLANAVNSLTKSLIDECAQLDAEPVSTVSSDVGADSFEAAFSLGPYSSTPTKSGLGPRRKALFLREAAAYLTIVSTSTALTQAGDRLPYTSALCEKVWNILADTDMQSRREKILSNPDARHAAYSGDDSFRLYLAAKAITFLALMFLGITPWNETLTERTLVVNDSVSNEQGEESGLEFLVSCLVTCLDCASDSRHCVEITASISSCIGIVLMNARRLNSVNPSRFLQRAICRLGTLPSMIGHTLEKSFQLLVTASFCGPEEDLCLMSLLSVLRGSLSWTRSNDSENDRAVDGEAGALNPRVEDRIMDEPQDDEFWGGLDDDLLASIDLATSDADGGHPRSNTGSLTAFCRLLSISLDQAKPSKRFEIVQSMVNSSTPDVAVLTASGRMLVADRSGPLCRCLAAILASDKNESSGTTAIVSQIWTAPVRFQVEKDHRDNEFQSSMARIISSELCNLALHSPRCRELVLRKHNEVLGNLLETLLDPKVLKKYPSCNLPRMKQNGGSSSEQKELSRLMKISGGVQKPDEFWNFCSDFGLALQGNENETPDNRSSETSAFLLNPDSDLSLLRDRRQNKMVPSMEKEYLDRFRVFRGITSITAINTQSVSAFDMMASVVLPSTSGHMIGIVKRFRIQERCQGEMDYAENYGRAKIIEEISSYIEFHVSIISWVFRERRHAVSSGPLKALSRVCDDYFSPLLQGKHIDVVMVLTQIISCAGSTHEDRGSSVTAVAIGSTESAAYHGMITEAILRRGREFMIEIAHEFSAGNTWRSSNFFRAMISAGTSNDDHAASMISRSFCSKAYSLPPNEGATTRSPLQTAIDDYLARVEKCHPLADQDTRSLLLLKRHALKEVLIPRLGHEHSLARTKCGILRLLRLMLDAEHDEGNSVDTDTRLNAYTLCYLAKAVCLSLRAALSANCVDDELVSSSFLCARSLINLPATCVDHDAVGWLIHWCNSYATECAGSDSTVKQSKAGYLWSFSQWLNDLGLFICDASGEAASESIQTYRNTLRKPQDPGDKNSWPPIKKEGTDFAGRMREYERVLFPDRENDENITNVYAARRDASNMNGAMEVWIPNTNVHRSVRSFVSEVKPVLES
jgi:hypothetical protein